MLDYQNAESILDDVKEIFRKLRIFPFSVKKDLLKEICVMLNNEFKYMFAAARPYANYKSGCAENIETRQLPNDSHDASFAEKIVDLPQFGSGIENSLDMLDLDTVCNFQLLNPFTDSSIIDRRSDKILFANYELATGESNVRRTSNHPIQFERATDERSIRRTLDPPVQFDENNIPRTSNQNFPFGVATDELDNRRSEYHSVQFALDESSVFGTSNDHRGSYEAVTDESGVCGTINESGPYEGVMDEISIRSTLNQSSPYERVTDESSIQRTFNQSLQYVGTEMSQLRATPSSVKNNFAQTALVCENAIYEQSLTPLNLIRIQVAVCGDQLYGNKLMPESMDEIRAPVCEREKSYEQLIHPQNLSALRNVPCEVSLATSQNLVQLRTAFCGDRAYDDKIAIGNLGDANGEACGELSYEVLPEKKVPKLNFDNSRRVNSYNESPTSHNVSTLGIVNCESTYSVTQNFDALMPANNDFITSYEKSTNNPAQFALICENNYEDSPACNYAQPGNYTNASGEIFCENVSIPESASKSSSRKNEFSSASQSTNDLSVPCERKSSGGNTSGDAVTTTGSAIEGISATEKEPRRQISAEQLRELIDSFKKGAEIICPICEKMFSSLKTLKVHLKRHEGRKDFECAHCAAKFGMRDDLSKHLRKHSQVKKHVCEKCGISFRRKDTFVNHNKATHERENRYDCANCSYHTFSRKCALWHMKRKHGQGSATLYACDICDSVRPSRSSLIIHIKSHTGEKPFLCYSCGATFATKQRLRAHVVGSHKPRGHNCSVCDKTFPTTHKLDRHLSSHTRLKPYACPFCDYYSTNVSSNLNHHVKVRHEVPHFTYQSYKKATSAGNASVSKEALERGKRATADYLATLKPPTSVDQLKSARSGARNVAKRKTTRASNSKFKNEWNALEPLTSFLRGNIISRCGDGTDIFSDVT